MATAPAALKEPGEFFRICRTAGSSPSSAVATWSRRRSRGSWARPSSGCTRSWPPAFPSSPRPPDRPRRRPAIDPSYRVVGRSAMIGIGTRIGREWLTDANDLHFLKQIGVDSVDVDFGIFEGYVESGGVLRKDALAAVVERLGAAGLRIERANYLSRELNPVYLDGPGASKAIDSVRRAIECLGEFDVPIMGLQRFEASSVLGRSAGVHSWQAGRGGYRYLHIDLRGEFPPAAPPVGAPTREELWERTIGLYLDLIPVAEGAGG